MKHKIILLVFLAASWQVRGQRVMKTDNLLQGLIEVRYEVLKKDKDLKDGSYKYTFGGFLLTEGQFQDGKKTGLWKFYSPDGKLSFMGNYFNGSRVGRWIYTYQGKEVADIIYSGEDQIGKRYALFPNGDTEFVWQKYYDGRDTLISHRRYFSPAHIKYTGISTDGAFQDTTFYRNGQIEMVLNYDKANDKKILVYLDSLGHSLVAGPGLLARVNRQGYNSVADIIPSFPGGDKVLTAFLSRAIRYPDRERRKNIQGIVKVSFVIDQEGYVGNVKVTQSVSRNLDAEAVKTIEEMPRWNPGMHNGLPVNVQYMLPIAFRLKGGSYAH